jgi:hypothetical protein
MSKLAIVSPCSTCKNQRSEPDANGLAACPRRFWQNQAKIVAARQNSNDVTSHFPVLIATGKERYGDTSGGALINPVYWDQGNCIAVWVAKLEDNQAIVSDTGRITNTDILSDSFDTTYTNCSLYPYTPEGNENEYFQKGSLKEGERIMVTDTSQQQLFSDNLLAVPIGGTVKRANFFYKVPRTPVDDHQSPEGL